ncbi:hypothetical protein [Micromonospora chersina]|nr:hypothetical protein [Micromonospora chersina]
MSAPHRQRDQHRAGHCDVPANHRRRHRTAGLRDWLWTVFPM